MLAPWKKSYDKHSVLKSRDFTLLTKVHIVKAMVFPVVMYGCESWTIKKVECRRTDAFKLWCWRRLESPLASKQVKPVDSNGNQPWIFIGRLMLKLQYFGYLMQRADSLEKIDPGKYWRKEAKGAREDERVGLHHWLNGLMFEQALRDSEGLGSLAWCRPWAHKESDTTWGLNNKQSLTAQAHTPKREHIQWLLNGRREDRRHEGLAPFPDQDNSTVPIQGQSALRNWLTPRLQLHQWLLFEYLCSVLLLLDSRGVDLYKSPQETSCMHIFVSDSVYY